MFDIDLDIGHDASQITEGIGCEEAEYMEKEYDMKPYDIAEHVNIGSCDVSSVAFTGHIDHLYDSHIDSDNEDYLYHIKKVTESDNVSDMKYHAEKAIDASKSKEYWENCKFDAEIESQKSDGVWEYINRQLEIIGQTQNDLESITNSTYSYQVSFGSGELEYPNELGCDSPMIGSSVSFGSATPWQDSGFQEFKSYLKYHCHIYSSEIPYTSGLINSSGDYDHSTISKLETWVRKLHASDRISNYDEEQLFKYLNRMK